MITQKEAVKLGKNLVQTMVYQCSKVDSLEKTNIRGIYISMIDSVWNGVIPSKTKEQFNYTKEKYYWSIGWPM
jgi:hypothetical protein